MADNDKINNNLNKAIICNNYNKIRKLPSASKNSIKTKNYLICNVPKILI